MNAVEAGSPPFRVVIADDATTLRALLRVLLEVDRSFEVVGEAGDGRRAIEVVEATRPDCILLDLAMPTMDGLAAIPHLRRASPALKIVVLSGFDQQPLSEAALAHGADHYLDKGTDLSLLPALLRKLLAAPAVS